MKNVLIKKIKYLITQNKLKVKFKTYIESEAYIKFELEGTVNKNFENELRGLLGFNVSVTNENGYVNIIFRNPNFNELQLLEFLNSDFFNNRKEILKFALGENVNGERIIGDLEKMIHLLVAGETGSGKSVCLHNIINSLVYGNDTSILRLVLMDLKRNEFVCYESLGHLLRPVVYTKEVALKVLKFLTEEMNKRFDLFRENKCRNIKTYNQKNEPIPYIVVIIDEFQNLILKTKEAENYIIDLATMARSAGIHLVLSTQKPSADVVTSLIKANIPTRIAFNVSDHYDSQVILGVSGAEKLNKKGDMLLKDEDGIERIQCCYISDEDIDNFIQDYNKKIDFNEINIFEEEDSFIDDEKFEAEDYEKCVEEVKKQNRCSHWMIKKFLNVGDTKAENIIQQLQDNKIISIEFNGSTKSYDILNREEGNYGD